MTGWKAVSCILYHSSCGITQLNQSDTPTTTPKALPPSQRYILKESTAYRTLEQQNAVPHDAKASGRQPYSPALIVLVGNTTVSMIMQEFLWYREVVVGGLRAVICAS